jgi:hypothetical protein
MMMKQLVLAIIPLLLMVSAATATTVSNLYAGGPRLDGPETPDPDVGACWVDGFDDGANDDYDSKKASECSDIPGDQYERAFELAKDICDEDAEVDKSGGDCADAREA